MGHWNYRIVKYRPGVLGVNAAPPGEVFGLHEVYYNDNGEPWAMTEVGSSFSGETPEEVIDTITMALKDAQERPVLEEPEKWADPDFKEEFEAVKGELGGDKPISH